MGWESRHERIKPQQCNRKNHVSGKKASGTHHQMWAREDSGRLDPAQQKQADEKAKREAKKAKANAWLKAQEEAEHSPSPDVCEDGENRRRMPEEDALRQDAEQKTKSHGYPSSSTADDKARDILKMRSTSHMFQDAAKAPEAQEEAERSQSSNVPEDAAKAPEAQEETERSQSSDIPEGRELQHALRNDAEKNTESNTSSSLPDEKARDTNVKLPSSSLPDEKAKDTVKLPSSSHMLHDAAQIPVKDAAQIPIGDDSEEESELA